MKLLTSQNPTPNPSNHPSCQKHAYINRTRANRSSNNENHATELNRSFPAIRIRHPRADDAAENGACAIDAIESADDVGRVCVSWLALRS